MLEFRDELSSEGEHVNRGAKNKVSGDSRIRKARLNARPRGPQSRFIVRPADRSVFQDEWDLYDGFGDYALTVTTADLEYAESLGKVTFWHPAGAQWCADPTTLHVVPRDETERRYLRELFYAGGGKGSARSRRTRSGNRRVPVVVVAESERVRPERDHWVRSRENYVPKRLRRKANRAARVAAPVAVAA